MKWNIAIARVVTLTMGICFMPDVLHAAVTNGVRVNSIGYKPALAKRATVLGDHGAAVWSIRRVSDGSVALSGKLKPATQTSDSAETVQLVDFTALTGQGNFYLDVDGVGKSVNFRVADDVYNPSFELQLGSLYGLRCGTAVTIQHGGDTFHHDACHLKDGKKDYVGGSGTVDGTGGWHDAGDYGKYMVNTAFTMGVMLKAWERFPDQLGKAVLPIPETGGSCPDYLDEMKYELDWMLKNAKVYKDGRIPHKLTRTYFAGMVMPEDDTEDRFWVPHGSAATAGFTAVMAQAARIYKPFNASYAAKLQAAADKSYTWLLDNPEDHPADQTGFSTGGYGCHDADFRLWAAAEMWESTGSAKALADFETRAAKLEDKIKRGWGWGDPANVGMFTYLDSKRKQKSESIIQDIRNDLVSVADAIIADADAQGFGRGLEGYFWGCNGGVALQGMILQYACDLTANRKYLDCAIDQISHLYGRNTYNRSYVTGEGINPPMHPHHRPSDADGIVNPWPGLLVGGGWPTATDWKDDVASFESNEIAINWTASMVYLLGMFVDYAETPAPISKADYHGWKAARLDNGAASAMVVPDIARVMAFNRADGPNLIWSDEALYGTPTDLAGKDWQNFGGSKLWVAPQSKWGWPPDPAIDGGPCAVSVRKGGAIHVTGTPSAKVGIRMDRDIKLSDDGAALQLGYTMVNTASTNVSWGIWQVVQVKGGGRIILPAPEGTKIWEAEQWKILDQWKKSGDILVLRHTGKDEGKVMCIGPEGWIAYEKDGEVFVLSFEADPDAVYPDGHGNAEVYVGEKYVELEHVAPLATLEPGRQTHSAERWMLFSLYGAQVDDQELAARVRAAIVR